MAATSASAKTPAKPKAPPKPAASKAAAAAKTAKVKLPAANKATLAAKAAPKAAKLNPPAGETPARAAKLATGGKTLVPALPAKTATRAVKAEPPAWPSEKGATAAKAPTVSANSTAATALPANPRAPTGAAARTAVPPPPAMPRPASLHRPMPRLPARQEKFAEGDYVVYPTHGVGKIERIATEEIAGQRLELIHITFEENRMTLRVPVAKARSAGLRKLSSRKQFDDALAVLRGRARIKRTMWSRRAQEYEAKINSGSPVAVAEVVRDLYRNAGQPDQSFSERQIYEMALDRLAAELGALERTDKLTAVDKLNAFLRSLRPTTPPAEAAD